MPMVAIDVLSGHPKQEIVSGIVKTISGSSEWQAGEKDST